MFRLFIEKDFESKEEEEKEKEKVQNYDICEIY